MSQVSAMIQIHSHDLVSRLKHGEHNCHICLCTGMWLNIDIFTAEQLLCSLSCKIFHNIHALTSAIISFPGYPSAYLFVKGLPIAAITALLTQFSDAISSIWEFCLSISAFIASAISGSVFVISSKSYILYFLHYTLLRKSVMHIIAQHPLKIKQR